MQPENSFLSRDLSKNRRNSWTLVYLIAEVATMIDTDSVEFSVKKPWEYKQSKAKKFFVEELGRHNFEHFVDFESWSRDSGEPVPKACQIPFVYRPKSLPISLKMKRWWEDREWYFSDVTNNFEGFEILTGCKQPELVEL